MNNTTTLALGASLFLLAAGCSSGADSENSGGADSTSSKSTTSIGSTGTTHTTGAGAGQTTSGSGAGGGSTGGAGGAGGGNSMMCPNATSGDFSGSCDGYATGLQCSGGDEPTFTCTCEKGASGDKKWHCVTDSGAGGGGQSYSGISTPLSTIPVENNAFTTIDPTAEVIELSPAFTCGAVATDVFDCPHQGFAFALEVGMLNVGSYDLSTLPGYDYRWLGACDDGGGGQQEFESGTLTITSIDATSIKGKVTGLVLKVSGPTMVLPSFVFEATRCN